MANNTPRPAYPKAVPARKLDELARDAKTLVKGPLAPARDTGPIKIRK
jgi:hypothetical protein